jgi:hypothetical protein
MGRPPMAVVNACTRDGQGGSPTAVVIDDATLTDDDRHAIARGTGTSHTAFIDTSTKPTTTAWSTAANCHSRWRSSGVRAGARSIRRAVTTAAAAVHRGHEPQPVPSVRLRSG